MNPFKVGDRVRFIDNELNRAESYFMEYVFVVDKVTNKPLCFLKFDDETGYNYPHPVSPLRLELAEPVGSREWLQSKIEGECKITFDNNVTYWDKLPISFVRHFDRNGKLLQTMTEERFYRDYVNSQGQIYTPAKFDIIIRNRNWKEKETIYCGVPETQAEAVRALLKKEARHESV